VRQAKFQNLQNRLAHEVLRLEFRSRAIYDYYGVPAAVDEALLGAPSKGSYFNRVIRGRFPKMCRLSEGAEKLLAAQAAFDLSRLGISAPGQDGRERNVAASESGLSCKPPRPDLFTWSDS